MALPDSAYPRISTTIFLPHLDIEFFGGFPLRKNQKKSQNSNEVKNGCTNSRVRIDCE